MFTTADIAFCPTCGTMLPSIPSVGPDLTCMACKTRVSLESFAETETSYTVKFNKKETSLKKKQGDDEDLGPIVDRKCPKCGHEQMSYAALQLRSADEGQTVFFTCLKCKYKESENS